MANKKRLPGTQKLVRWRFKTPDEKYKLLTFSTVKRGQILVDYARKHPDDLVENTKARKSYQPLPVAVMAAARFTPDEWELVKKLPAEARYTAVMEAYNGGNDDTDS